MTAKLWSCDGYWKPTVWNDKKQPFSNMSRKPGIGRNWIKKYTSDVYPDGKMVVNGNEVPPPKYYDRYYKKKAPKRYIALLQQRHADALARLNDNTNDRLQAKETVRLAQYSKLKRKL